MYFTVRVWDVSDLDLLFFATEVYITGCTHLVCITPFCLDEYVLDCFVFLSLSPLSC